MKPDPKKVLAALTHLVDWLDEARDLTERQIDRYRILVRGKPLTCGVCGCTNIRACRGGCAWHTQSPPLCTACFARKS